MCVCVCLCVCVFVCTSLRCCFLIGKLPHMLLNSWRAPLKLSGCFWYWILSFCVIQNVVTQKTVVRRFAGLKNYEIKLLFCTFIDQFMIVLFFSFAGDQLFELQIAKDLPIVFEEENFLKEDEERNVFRTALQMIGRIDLVKKFQIYIATGKL